MKHKLFGSMLLVIFLAITGCGGGGDETSTTPTPTSAPAITTQPASRNVTEGQTATFTVVANGAAPLTYQWMRDSVNVGSDSASYTTPPTTTSDNGAKFSVVVTNAVDHVHSSEAILTVRSAMPSFSPAPGTYGTNKEVTINCTPAGATIYYTTDGTQPTTTSSSGTSSVKIMVYGSPVTTTVIKAMSVKSGLDSSTATGSYTIDNTAPCTLRDSGNITVTAHNQVIEGLRIISDGAAGILVNGFNGVLIRNCEIRHKNAAGIQATNAQHLTIENVAVTHTGAPDAGANANTALNNIFVQNSPYLVAHNVYVEKGSSGFYIVSSPHARLAYVEGHDFRGPYPRGQFIQFNLSDDCQVEDFYADNPPATSFVEDIINFYMSNNGVLKRGFINGNNSGSGAAVQIEDGSADVLVEDVDAIHQACGCFYAYEGIRAIFRRVGCRDHICVPQPPRNLPPASNGLMFGANTTLAEHIRIENSKYKGPLCPGGLVWDKNVFDVIDLTEVDFTPQEHISLSFCWK